MAYPPPPGSAVPPLAPGQYAQYPTAPPPRSGLGKLLGQLANGACQEHGDVLTPGCVRSAAVVEGCRTFVRDDGEAMVLVLHFGGRRLMGAAMRCSRVPNTHSKLNLHSGCNVPSSTPNIEGWGLQPCRPTADSCWCARRPLLLPLTQTLPTWQTRPCPLAAARSQLWAVA